MLFINTISKKVLLIFCLLSFYINLTAQDTLSVYVDTINYSIDTLDANLYHVPVRVVNMGGIVGFDITIQTGAGATMVAVSDTLIPAAGTTINLLNDTTLRLLYLDFSGASLTVDNDEVIFVMAVSFDGLPGDCFPFEITAFEAVHIDDPGATIPFNATAGEICLPTTITISGNVMDYDALPLDSVEVQLIQGDSIYFTVTDTSGLYTFEEVAIGDTVMIIPSAKLNEVSRAERIAGINIIDLIKIVRHLLGAELLDDPYKMIAADINDNLTITTTDLIQLQSYIIYKTDVYPTNAFYRFIDGAFVFPDPTNPWSTSIPEAIIIENPANDLENIDFIGVRIGDVY